MGKDPEGAAQACDMDSIYAYANHVIFDTISESEPVAECQVRFRDERPSSRQYNIGRIRRPLDHPDVAEFIASLDPINALAEDSPGFVWRLTDDDGQSSSYVKVEAIGDPLLVVNYSIWSDLESLKHFVRKSGHIAYLYRRREWFEQSEEATSVAWWISEGTIPDVCEAHQRLIHVRENGRTATRWPLAIPWPVPES
jgi:hypothetical protein